MQIAGVLWDVELNFMYCSNKMLQMHSYVHWGGGEKSFPPSQEPLFLSLVLHFASFDALEVFQNVY